MKGPKVLNLTRYHILSRYSKLPLKEIRKAHIKPEYLIKFEKANIVWIEDSSGKEILKHSIKNF